MTSAAMLEMVELVAKRGYRDGYDEQPALSRRNVAKQFIGPVFGAKDADCTIAVYRMFYSVGDEQRLGDVAEEREWSESNEAVYKTDLHFCDYVDCAEIQIDESSTCHVCGRAQTAPDAPERRSCDGTKDGTAK